MNTVKDLNFSDSPEKPRLEIDLIVRDAHGQPTEKRKEFKSTDGHSLWEFWMRHQGRPNRKKKTNKKEKTPTKDQADQIVKDMKSYKPNKKHIKEG